MCGIAGLALADPRAPVDRSLVERMAGTLRHRGPDSGGLHVAPGVGLGVRRLAIVDLVNGDQPLSGEDGAVSVIANGEIYNSPELQEMLEAKGHRFRGRSDVEAIAHLYEDLGVEALGQLRGMFAFALWDARRRRLLLARDRVGIKPLHYAVTPEALYFGSEQKAILASGTVSRRIDPRALDDVFRWGFVRTPATLFADIRRLPPGHYLVYEAGQVTIRPYWRIPRPSWREAPPRTTAQWGETLRDKLQEVVAIHVRSDVRIGAWLSTGIDSSGVVAMAARLIGSPMPTFTLAHDISELDETRRRRTLDRFPGFDLTNERVPWGVKSFERFPAMLWHNEDPTAYALEVPRFALAEASSRHCKVVLTGEGSDEVLGGYARFLYDPWLRRLSHVPAPLRRLALAGGVLPRRHPWAARMLFAPRGPASARYELLIAPHGAPRRGDLYAGDVKAAVDAAPEREEWAEPPGEDWHPFDGLQRHELTTCMVDFIVPTLDRGSMAHGVEARVPFLDHELVELCMQIPPWQKVHALTEKRVLREALRGVVPEDVRVRRKWGLRAPIASWMRPPLPRFASELLSVDALHAKGYFAPSAVQALLTRHQAGAAELRSQIQAVLAVQVWDEMFVRGRDPRDLI